ncbi:MAG: hypothetical protein KGS48_04875 [Bacteroidetes bacterium]|nr:hypothetical protein [Bacteroidota bacterium]
MQPVLRLFRRCMRLLCLLLATHVQAQSGSEYVGYRLGVFQFEIRQITTQGINLRCEIANTGKKTIDFSPEKPPPQTLIVEVDSIALPIALHGHSDWIIKALYKQKIKLAPGEMKRHVSLNLTFPDLAPNPDSTACPDLVFDSVYLTRYTQRQMWVHFIIRNIGTAPAQLLGMGNNKEKTRIQVYFVSGARLTRGAILAGSVQIENGQELLRGYLNPGQVFQGDIEVNLKNRTRFSPNLVLELDPFLSVAECRRTNNTKVLLIEY